MNQLSKKSFYIFQISFILLAMISFIYIYTNDTMTIIRSDGYGYYAYLTSIFIDGNFSFKTAIEMAPYGHTMDAIGLHTLDSTGKILNKYTVGVAILELPFFIIAHLYSFIFGFDMLGYSEPYQYSIAISSVFYALLGNLFLYRTLLLFSDKTIALITMTSVVLATSLYHYSTYDASFSHIYSYFLVSVFVYNVFTIDFRSSNLKFLFLGVILGLIIITRVPNIIVGFLLFYILSKYISKHKSKNDKFCCYQNMIKKLFVLMLGTFIVVSLQLLYWHHVSGQIFVNSYVGESFNFLSPEILNYLFSIRKGLFFWSPILLLSIIGLVALCTQRRECLLTWLLGGVFLLHTYIASSWWSWYFGGSFGNRVIVDILPILGIPLAICLNLLKEKLSITIVALIILFFVFLNINFMYSYWKGYIPLDGTTLNHIVRLPSKISYDIKNYFVRLVYSMNAESANKPLESFSFSINLAPSYYTNIISVEIKNDSVSYWPSVYRGKYGLAFSYGIVDDSENVNFDSRIFLPYDVAPGETVEVTLDILGLKKSENVVCFNMVQESVRWFNEPKKYCTTIYNNKSSEVN